MKTPKGGPGYKLRNFPLNQLLTLCETKYSYINKTILRKTVTRQTKR